MESFIAETPAPCETDSDTRSSDSMGPSSARLAAMLADSLDSGARGTPSPSNHVSAPPALSGAQASLPQKVLDLGTFVADTPPDAEKESQGLTALPSSPRTISRQQRAPTGTETGSPRAAVVSRVLRGEQGRELGEGARVTGEGSTGGEGGLSGSTGVGVRTPVAAQLTLVEQELMDTGLISPPRDYSMLDPHGLQQSGLVLSPVRVLSPIVGSAGSPGPEEEGRAMVRQSPCAKQCLEGAAGLLAGEARAEAREGEVVLELGSQVQALAISACGRYLKAGLPVLFALHDVIPREGGGGSDVAAFLSAVHKLWGSQYAILCSMTKSGEIDFRLKMLENLGII